MHPSISVFAKSRVDRVNVLIARKRECCLLNILLSAGPTELAEIRQRLNALLPALNIDLSDIALCVQKRQDQKPSSHGRITQAARDTIAIFLPGT